jgi:hypothetical protein
MLRPGLLGWDLNVIVDFGQILSILASDIPALIEKPVDLFELSEPNRGSDIGHPIVVPDDWKPVTAIWVHALASQEPQPVPKRRIRGRNHATFPGRQDLVAIEAKSCGMRQGSDLAIFINRAVRFGGILNDKQIVPACYIQDAVHIRRMTIKMNGDDTLSSLGNGLFQQVWIEVHRTGL